ncbi:MAG: MBL fold metallo-hydrolase [Lactobacillales bacterium]|jgi:glyoxylase-like metal-dependent hydrolase (beta-lactamase superfamily II)|nr:MBL fold metallo-hydrolase [Lactobacillales bacterium]
MLEIECVKNQIADENTYFIFNEQTTLIVDPGSDEEVLLKTLKKINRQPGAILLTHTHYDHIMGVECLRRTADFPVYVSVKEEKWLFTPNLNLSGLLRHASIKNVIVNKANEFFIEDKEYTIGGITFKVIATPGHTVGGVSFVFDNFVLTGDVLFKGTVGRTDLPTGDLDQLLASIQKKLFNLSEDLIVFPGHAKATTIGQEKRENSFFQ